MIPDWSDERGTFYVCHSWGYMEDDEPRHCSLCGAELAVSILSGRDEIYHWSAYDPETPTDWRILSRLFDLYEPYLIERRPPWTKGWELVNMRKNAARLLLVLRRVLMTEDENAR